MERLKSLQAWFNTLMAAVCAVLAIYLDKIENNLNKGLYIVFILISLILIIKSAESILEYTVSHSSIFRRYLFGDSFVEGLWVNVVIDKTNQTVLFGGIILFKYRMGEIHESGYSFNVDGKFMGTFETTHTYFEDLCLRYTYTLDSTGAQPVEIKGYGETKFKAEESGPPMVYTGFFCDTIHNSSLHVYGEKLSDKDEIISLKSFERKRSKVKAFINDYLELMPFNAKTVERLPVPDPTVMESQEIIPPDRIEPNPIEIDKLN